MNPSKAAIIARLQKEILPLQGFRRALHTGVLDGLPAPIKKAFPFGEFPLGAVHEFFSTGAENAAATGGFVAGMLAALMKSGGACIWIGTGITIFPPALKLFGIVPEKIIFINLQKEKDILWTMEEALKCEGLAAVVGEMQELSFTASRRLQLAVEQSNVTGFILRCNPRSVNTTACITRWQVNPLPALVTDGLPGIGFPRWKVTLLKVRNGNPGTWQVAYVGGSFRHVQEEVNLVEQLPQRKAG